MDDIEVYDSVPAHTLEDGDQIAVENEEGGTDYLEDIKVVHDVDSVLVKGLSWVTGDKATYILDMDKAVGLWTV